MLSLGLDPSLTGYGWVVHNPDGVGKDRVVEKGRFRTTTKQIFLERYIYLRESVFGVLQRYPEIDIVGLESPPFGQQYSEGLFGLFMFTNEAVYRSRRDIVYFDPLTVKMLAKEDPDSRPGKMYKADMRVLAMADTGIKSWSADAADAYHIARFAARFQQLSKGLIDQDVLLESEKRAFLRLTKQGVGTGTLFKENDRFYRFSQVEGKNGKGENSSGNNGS